MQDGPGRHRGGSPLFSIIIPLEYHRGQWEQSWLGWTSQTADKSLYEIILVVPPDFKTREELEALAADKARIEFTESEHDIGLCAFGATKARGRYLFFTESHCWPEPNVIELCIRAIEAHPDWAGFSCHSVPICHNRLSLAEAAMYQADIEFGMKQHPWRKVLDQCFVTRRDVYWECGGLREELGHFAEWVLAATYHAKGYAIGYLEEARFHHWRASGIAPRALNSAPASDAGVPDDVPGVILARVEINFRAELRAGEEIEVRSRCTRIGTKSFDLEHEIWAGERKVADAKSVLVGYDYAAGASAPLTNDQRKRLESE